MFATPGLPTEADFDDFPSISATNNFGANRRPAVNGRVTGSITEWKGKFGWIVPDAPIMHPEARMKGGRIYMSQEDVLEVISGVGAEVSFYVYSDGNGLGALHVVPVDSATAQKKLTRKAATAPMKPKAKAPVATPGRTRVSQELLKGKVKSWRGGFGFVTPASPVDHPLFTGSLFLHSNDIVEGEVADGKKISFYIYRDPQGLGAENCTILDDDEDIGGDFNVPPTPASPVPGTALEPHESSGLLKAKPKGAAADGIMVARAKGGSGIMKAAPKASAAVKAGDPELARKMAENPELAKQLSAWMFDAGG